MAEGSSSSGSRKRSFVEDDDSNKPPSEKRVRFPKGKKLKQGENVLILPGEEIIHDPNNPRLVATKLAQRRNNFTTELLRGEGSEFVPDVRKVEMQYQEEESFVKEGVKIEPFNLDKEREEGYFDENENYVQYVNRNDIKDAWLDSVDADKKYTGVSSHPPSTIETPRDLVTEDLAEINRRIANVLEPGETVLRALRRLKGSSDKKHKMSAETKQLFDQLTVDAMKLMENGDYNVYEEKQEHFKREAEGYEKIINTRKGGVSESLLPSKSEDDFDMFADDDGVAAAGNVTTNEAESVNIQPSNSEDLLNDYVYDESSGYYYSNRSGYYYDPSSGFYFSATSGKWYCYNQESEMYEEVPHDTGANMSEL